MLGRTQSQGFPRFRPATMLLVAAMAALPVQTARARIMCGQGNGPLHEPGWPKGAAAVFNSPARVAWTAGTFFGPGEWCAECRGDAKALSDVLADFAKLDVKNKRVVLHYGVGRSVVLNPHNDPSLQAATGTDWDFTVWEGAQWDLLREELAKFDPTDLIRADKGPPARIDVYSGGHVHWPDVTVPNGLEVIDERLEPHGFTPADGVVLEGKVIDLATHRPVAARVRSERLEEQPGHAWHYIVAAKSASNAEGRWVMKKAPPDGRVVVEADGYVPRVVGRPFDQRPHWQSYNCGLSRPGPVSGRISDNAGKPLAGVEVQLDDVVSSEGGRYESPHRYAAKTGADGRFRLDQIPIAKATIRLHKSGYCRPDLSQPIGTPSKDVALSMIAAASVHVTVNFAGTDRTASYLVTLGREGGPAIGKRPAPEADIDAKNQVTFEDVPPGTYFLQGRPNVPFAQRTKRLVIHLKGEQTTEVILSAK